MGFCDRIREYVEPQTQNSELIIMSGDAAGRAARARRGRGQATSNNVTEQMAAQLATAIASATTGVMGHMLRQGRSESYRGSTQLNMELANSNNNKAVRYG